MVARGHNGLGQAGSSQGAAGRVTATEGLRLGAIGGPRHQVGGQAIGRAGQSRAGRRRRRQAGRRTRGVCVCLILGPLLFKAHHKTATTYCVLNPNHCWCFSRDHFLLFFTVLGQRLSHTAFLLSDNIPFNIQLIFNTYDDILAISKKNLNLRINIQYMGMPKYKHDTFFFFYIYMEHERLALNHFVLQLAYLMI